MRLVDPGQDAPGGSNSPELRGLLVLSGTARRQRKRLFSLSELLVGSNTDQSFFFFFVAYCYLEFIWLCFFFKILIEV